MKVFGKTISFADAWSSVATNKFRMFGGNKADVRSVIDRCNSKNFPELNHKPKFGIHGSSKFFTVGSCFARNIERALAQHSVTVLNHECLVPGTFYRQNSDAVHSRNAALNAYTPHSMRDLININKRNDRGTAGILKMSEETDEWCDMMMAGLRNLSLEEVRVARGELLKTYELLPSADVVVITLGYTESWWDTGDQIYTNRSPGSTRQTSVHNGRFQYVNADSEMVRDALKTIIGSINDQTSGRAKIILTVSPVPLSGTYTSMDIVSANLYSKSTLLTEARYASAKYDNVDYFPSYEYVMFSRREDTWEIDGRHVKSAIVSKVMSRFLELYIHQ